MPERGAIAQLNISNHSSIRSNPVSLLMKINIWTNSYIEKLGILGIGNRNASHGGDKTILMTKFSLE
jgi:hypothetical protein